MNTRVDRDDFIHALGQTLRFYKKDLEEFEASFWWTACKDVPVRKLKDALLEYPKRGKFAPKPADILEIVGDNGQRHAENALPPPPMETKCPPEISRAWMWYIGQNAKGTSMDGLFDSSLKVDLETQEKYLHIVNHEAHRVNNPDAIAPEHRLREVWG
jgi:hypothetical protein